MTKGQQAPECLANRALDAVRDACCTARAIVIIVPQDRTDKHRGIAARGLTKVETIRELERVANELYDALDPLQRDKGPSHEH